MDYLSHFGLTSEPFSNAPLSRFYFASRQHTDALERLRYAAATMKGLAIVIGDIGLGKTTLARRMLEALPEDEYEAAMLVIVHAGITANWLLKRIAIQVGVPNPAGDKLTILSQLYNRLVEIRDRGKRAVVLIDEAQMLATRELMEEFRGLLNLEVPEQKLISFIFFGLPEIERNLRLDPPLAQRIALRYHLKSLAADDAVAYVRHRLDLAGGAGREFFSDACLEEIVRYSGGVPRLVNTICDNLLLEMFFTRTEVAGPELVVSVGQNLGLGEQDLEEPAEQPLPADEPAVEGGPGSDAIVAVDRDSDTIPEAATPEPLLEPAAIAAQVAAEPMPPIAFGADEDAGEREAVPVRRPDLEAVPAWGAGGATADRAEGEAEAQTGVELRPDPGADIEVDIEVDVEVDVETVEDAKPPDILAAPAPPSAPTAGPPQEAARSVDKGPPVVPLEVGEKPTTVDIEDPLAFLEQQALPSRQSDQPSPWEDDEELPTVEVEVEEEVPELPDYDLDVVEKVPVGETLAAVVPVGDGIDVEVVVDEETDSEAAPMPATTPAAPRVEPEEARSGPARPKSTIDLSEIDALLADLNLDRK